MNSPYEDTVPAGSSRCQAAYPDYRSRCDGPRDAVQVVDRGGYVVAGCATHAATLLASVAGARAYLGSVEDAAVRAYELARQRRASEYDSGVGVSRGATTIRLAEDTTVRCGAESGSDRVWLTLRHARQAITAVLSGDQVGTLVDALTTVRAGHWRAGGWSR